MTTEAADVEFFFSQFYSLDIGAFRIAVCQKHPETFNEKAATCGTVRESQPKQGL